MKIIIRLLILAFCVLNLTHIKAGAQTSLVNVNVQPVWGPAGHSFAAYYYLPAVESYYSVNERKFIYLEGGRWIARPHLAKNHAGYNLFSGYKIVMNTSRPYLNFTNDRIRYCYYKSYKNKQKNLRDERKMRFATVNTQPKHVTVKQVKGKKHKLKIKHTRPVLMAEN